MSTIRIFGFTGEEAVELTSDHVVGDPRLLTAHPDRVQLVIRKAKRPRDDEEERWRPYNGSSKLPPARCSEAPAIFQGTVYDNLQHAMLACLLWAHGGGSRGDEEGAPAFSYEFYPAAWPGVMPPQLIFADGAEIGLVQCTGAVAVYFAGVDAEPPHAELLQIANAARPIMPWCLVLVGALSVLRPTARATPRATPQLRGILIDTSRMGGPDAAVFPEGSIEHGWYPCIVPATDRFRLSRNCQGVSGDYIAVWRPVSMPAFRSIGMKLWRRGTAAFCIAGRDDSNTAEWDTLIEGRGETAA